MEHKTARGIKISQMTLGTVQLGLNYGISNSTGKPSRDESYAILDSAIDGGVNSFDTAMAYGDSENILGGYFCSRKTPVNDCVITTKFVFKEKKQMSQKEMDDAVTGFAEQSLERLRQGKLQIVMLHHYDDLEHYGAKLVNSMKKLKAAGLADKIGVSVHNPLTIKNVLDYSVFDAIQAPLNILDNRIPKSGLLEKAHEEDVIIFIRSVFLQGLIFKDNISLPAALSCAAPYLDMLREIAESENISVEQLAVAYVRDLPGVTSLVIGSETKQQVMQNVSLMKTPCLSEKALSKIEKSFDDIPEIVINPVRWSKV